MSITGVVLLILALLLVAILALVLRTRALAAQAERQVPQAGQVAPVPGGAIHFVELGPEGAPPLVLIHGLSGQLQHFTYALAGLLAQEFRVIALDRPGCGYSRRDSDDLASLPEQARMIGAFLDARGIESPVLVGHSLGGAVALALALDRPGKIAALALLCPLTRPVTETPPVFKGLMVTSPGLRRLIGHTLAVPLAHATRDRVLAEVFAPEPAPGDFLTRAGGALGFRPQAFIAASADLIGQMRSLPAQAARHGDLAVPGGVLFGAEDPILAPETQGAAMRAHGLDFETLPGRGHMIPITAPGDCADFIRRMAAKRV
jgi:pimeloyl-ACP methyl ester carboxylesterase